MALKNRIRNSNGIHFRLLNERAIQIKGGYKKAIEMLKTGKFAYIADDISAKTLSGYEFGFHGVCKFYLTIEPFLTSTQKIIFPVSIRHFLLSYGCELQS